MNIPSGLRNGILLIKGIIQSQNRNKRDSCLKNLTETVLEYQEIEEVVCFGLGTHLMPPFNEKKAR